MSFKKEYHVFFSKGRIQIQNFLIGANKIGAVIGHNVNVEGLSRPKVQRRNADRNTWLDNLVIKQTNKYT